MFETVPSQARGSGDGAEVAVHLVTLRTKRELLQLRLHSVLVAVAFVLLAAWLATLVPGGMRPEDYSVRVVATLILAVAVMTASLAVLVRWNGLLREEPVSELWAALAGQSMSLRSRARFTRRIDLQCRRAAADRRRSFALLILDFVDPGEGVHRRGPTEAAIPIVRGAVRNADIVGDSGSTELWVLLDQASAQAAAIIAGRITSGIDAAGEVAAGGDGARIRAGYSVFDDDGRTEAALFECARRRMRAGFSDGGDVVVPAPRRIGPWMKDGPGR